MSAVDIVCLRGRDVQTESGLRLAGVTGTVDRAVVHDADGDLLLNVVKGEAGHWFARRPDGTAILRIDPSPTRLHAVTYADGRTGRFDAAPDAGSWELVDDRDGRLVVHARSTGGRVLEWFDWQCAQDGTLHLTDFLATVVTYRAVRTVRRRYGQSVSLEW